MPPCTPRTPCVTRCDQNRYVEDFILVTPIEYKRVLQEEKMRQLEEKIANMQLINN